MYDPCSTKTYIGEENEKICVKHWWLFFIHSYLAWHFIFYGPDTLIDKNRKKPIIVYFRSFAVSSFTLQPFCQAPSLPFVKLHQSLLPRQKVLIVWKNLRLKEETRKGRRAKRAKRQRGGEGRQGFQINYWSGVRWTFNLTNQLPNYTSAARTGHPIHFWCVCVCLCV